MIRTDDDVCNFDFKKLYYIRQLSNYFIVNKIINYIPGKPVKCELVRVLYNDVTIARIPLRITKVIVTGQMVAVWFENTTGNAHTNFVADRADNGQHSFTSTFSFYPFSTSFTPTGKFNIRIEAGEFASNEVEITIPSNKTITPQF